jgi:hypothetical protein
VIHLQREFGDLIQSSLRLGVANVPVGSMLSKNVAA